MALNDWKSNRILIENLRKTIMMEQLSHAIIIEGNPFIDKLAFAKDIIKALICTDEHGNGCDECINCHKIEDENYDDMFILNTEGNSVKDSDIEELQTFIKRKPSLEKGNVAIICNADTLTIRAQNRILKTLEEPSKGSHIILLSENTESLLDTVKSRCVIYRLDNDQTSYNDEALDMARLIKESLEDEGYFHKIKKLTEKSLKDKGFVMSLLDGMERVYRDCLFEPSGEGILYRKEDIFKYIRFIEEAKKDLRFNVNPSVAFKNLILKIGG